MPIIDSQVHGLCLDATGGAVWWHCLAPPADAHHARQRLPVRHRGWLSGHNKTRPRVK
jgi:hypothetical protein